MKLKVVTLTTDMNHHGLLKLKASLDKFGYDYHIIFQDVPPGTHVFGTQMPFVYDWCKNKAGDYTHILYTDAWDTMALGSIYELLEKIPADIQFFGSAEKACFPKPELAKQYPPCDTDWKYVNGGGWLAKISFFVRMYEEIPAFGVNDQLWLAERFLYYQKIGEQVALDYDCKIFQTYGFEHEGDFFYNREAHQLENLKTGEFPVFIHGNGRTDMTKIYELAG